MAQPNPIPKPQTFSSIDPRVSLLSPICRNRVQSSEAQKKEELGAFWVPKLDFYTKIWYNYNENLYILLIFYKKYGIIFKKDIFKA